MMGRSSSFLGLAVSDRSVACAELAPAGGGAAAAGERHTVRRTATFTFPEGLALDNPGALGQALATFLRQKRFTATRAVVGVPARWLIAMEREVPPADEQQARATLRLQAERLAVAESGDVVFDFAGRTSTSAVSKVLLVGMVRDRLVNVEQMMDAAGMSVAAITSTGLTLASCAAGARGGKDAQAGGQGGLLFLGRGGGEVVWRHDGAPRMLRHVAFVMNGHGMPPIGPVAAELHRAVAMAASNGAAGQELLLLDGVGMPAEQVDQLAARLGLPVKASNGADVLKLRVDPGAAADAEAGENPAAAVGRFAPAMSLALAAAKPELLPLDFKHSRLTPLPVRRIGRAAMWGIGIGAVLLISIVALFVTVNQRENELAALDAQLKGIGDPIKTAQAQVDRLKLGRGFFEARPPALGCLREITLAFRDDERIWVTSFNFRDTGRGTLAGKAADQRFVLGLLDRLKNNPGFADVKLVEMQTDARSREVSFSMTFAFNAAANAATANAPSANTNSNTRTAPAAAAAE